MDLLDDVENDEPSFVCAGAAQSTDSRLVKKRRTVLDLIREHSDERVRARHAEHLLHSDEWSEDAYLRLGLFLRRSAVETLRFKSWRAFFSAPVSATHVAWRGLQHGHDMAFIGGATKQDVCFCSADDFAGSMLRTELPSPLSMLRWNQRSNCQDIGAISRSSRCAWIVSLGEGRIVQEMLDLQALTTVQDVAFATNNVVFAGTRDGSICSWDRRNALRKVSYFSAASPASGAVNCLQSTADGQVLLSSCTFGRDVISRLDLWDVRMVAGNGKAKPMKSFQMDRLFEKSAAPPTTGVGQMGQITSMQIDPLSDRRVAMQFGSGLCSVLDLVHQSPLPVWNAVPAQAVVGPAAYSVCFVPNSPWIAYSDDLGVRFSQFDISNDDQDIFSSKSFLIMKRLNKVTSISCHPTGNCVAYTREGGEVEMFGLDMRRADLNPSQSSELTSM